MPRYLRWKITGFAKQLKQKNSRKGGARGPRFRLRSRLTPNLGGGGLGGFGGGGLSGIGGVKLPRGQQSPPASQSQAPPPKQQKKQKPPPKQKKKGKQTGGTSGG